MKVSRRVVLSTLLLAGCSSGDVTPRKEKVALFGDSTLWGAPSHIQPYQGQRLDENIAQRMQSFGVYDVDNFAINGDAPEELLLGVNRSTTFDKWLSGSDHDILLFGYGVASAIRLDKTFENSTRSLVTKTIEAGKKVFLRDVTPVFTTNLNPAPTAEHVLLADKFRSITKEIACNLSTGFVDLSTVAFSTDEMWDGFHPNQSYANRLAESCHNALINNKKLECIL